MENNKNDTSRNNRGEQDGKTQAALGGLDALASIKAELAQGRAPLLDDLKGKLGGKEVNKALRDLAREGVAGVHRRKLRSVDGGKYKFAEGVVEQRGPGRFLLTMEGGAEAYLTAKSSKSVLAGDVVRCFLAQEPGEDAEALPSSLIRRDPQRVHVMRAKPKLDGTAGFFIDNRVEDVLLDARIEPQLGDIWECKVQEPGLLRDVVFVTAHRRIGNEADRGIESSLAFSTRFPESAKVVESAWSEPLSLEDSFDKAQRVDIRNLPLATIDGEHARDFDDAIAGVDAGTHWKLTIAIADVSAHVGAGSALGQKLDELALQKMTSVYLPHEVYPMLPTQVSNGISSLKPGEDRLALVCDIEVGKDGQVLSHRFYRALMQSHARLTYESAQLFLDGGAIEASEPVKASLECLNAAGKAMRQAGFESGRLDMGENEIGFALDAGGKIETLTSSPRLWTHKLVEECMLAANRAAAQYIYSSTGIGVFRNHVGVREDGLEQVHMALDAMGLKVGDGVSNITQPQIAKALEGAKSMGKYAQARSAILGSMSSANYEAGNAGHFSLVAPFYCHFTSPIRRYPDLMVHRMIKAIIDGAPAPYSKEDAADLAQRATRFGQLASQAENESRKLLTLEFVRRQLAGKDVEAVVSTIGERGLWVAVPLGDASSEFFISAKSLKDRGSAWQEDAQSWLAPSGLLIEGQKIPCKVAKIDMGARRVEIEPFPGLEPALRGSSPKRF